VINGKTNYIGVFDQPKGRYMAVRSKRGLGTYADSKLAAIRYDQDVAELSTETTIYNMNFPAMTPNEREIALRPPSPVHVYYGATNTKTGIIGVSLFKQKKRGVSPRYRAIFFEVQNDSTRHTKVRVINTTYLGYFDSKIEAGIAYDRAVMNCLANSASNVEHLTYNMNFPGMSDFDRMTVPLKLNSSCGVTNGRRLTIRIEDNDVPMTYEVTVVE
jgi:hypothetical protein